MPDLQFLNLPSNPADAGYEHGKAIAELLQPSWREPHIERVRLANRHDPDRLGAQAGAWLTGLEPHVQIELEAMGHGAGVPTLDVARFLYADIASPHAAPLCSTVITPLGDRSPWIARNCDWLTATLERGTAAVAHSTPHRIPILAVGIRGDIDVDTGINAEGLWLHLHTMHATDTPPEGSRVISWLFWAREALETCASLDELESFIRDTYRDRGVIAIAAESRSGRAAVFECGRSSYRRRDPDGPVCVTNHSLDKHYPKRPRSTSNESGTISRQQTMRGLLDRSPPKVGPSDLMEILATRGVEMRTPTWIRTIYSAVVDLAGSRIWFAAGTPDGTPAASRGGWSEITPPWL